MTKYTVKYSPFVNKYLVINEDTGLAQSFWESPVEAARVARDLTAHASGPQHQELPKPSLKVVRHLRVVS